MSLRCKLPAPLPIAYKGFTIAVPRFYEFMLSAPRISLIDGARLAELMDLYDVGVQPEQTFIIKRIDEDFFE